MTASNDRPAPDRSAAGGSSPAKLVKDAGPLREHYGKPLEMALALHKPALDALHRRFIAHSPFICLATADASGQPSVSPKGDAPGFVRVLDDRTLLIPDRPGNRKIRGLENMVQNDRIALIFMIPGVSETLRVEGRARITLDDKLLESGKVDGKNPPAAIVIEIDLVYIHCGKAMVRSRLWDEDSRVAPGTVPSLAEFIVTQDGASTDTGLEKIEALVDHVYKDELY